MCINCSFELIAFVLVEIFTRHVFPGKGCSRLVLLSSQFGFLAMFVAFILLHHVPYLLLLLLLIIVCVLVRMYMSLQSSRNQYISKPLLKSSSRTDPNTPRSQISHMTVSQMGNFRPAMSSLDLDLPNNCFHSTGYNVRGTQKNRSLRRKPLSNLRSEIQSKPLPPIRTVPKSPFISKFPPLNYIQSMFDFKHTPDPRPPGFINSGNTCFINSILQCLTWTPGLAEGLASTFTESNVFVTTLFKLMFQITHQTDQHDSTVSPSDFLLLMSNLAPHLVTKSGLSFQSQQDSAEFLLWILNHIHTEAVKNSSVVSSDFIALKENKQTRLAELSLMKSNDQNFGTKVLEYSQLDWYLYTLQARSPIYEQCLGQILEARECQLCNRVSLNIDYFMVLPLPLPKSKGAHDVVFLDECFNSFSCVEKLTGSNMMTCSCIVPNEESLTPGTRIALLSKVPPTLIMQLSRYTYDTTLQATVKNKACIRFNTTFQVPISIESRLGVSSSKSPSSVVYRLVGVCVHSGAENTSYGHYVAYCLTPTGWCYFNDETVSKVSNIEEALKDYFILQNAYLLFYSCF